MDIDSSSEPLDNLNQRIYVLETKISYMISLLAKYEEKIIELTRKIEKNNSHYNEYSYIS